MAFFNSLLDFFAAIATGVVVAIHILPGLLSPQLTYVGRTPLPQTPVATSSSTVRAPAGTVTGTAKTSQTPKAGATPAATPVAPTTPSTPAPQVTNELIAQVNATARASLVNILCSFRTRYTLSYISGSGLIIDPRGVILTNAHVAQYFLTQNYPSQGSGSCSVRTGSPAVAAYTAALLYIPPTWIAGNASQILSDQQMGTGERDYAFLYITGPAPYAPALSSSFPALSISTANPTQGDAVLLAAYPAGFLSGDQIQRSLYISSAVSALYSLYTFTSPHEVDLMSLGGTAVAQSGSSGGAVINLLTNKLIGLISTDTEGTTTALRNLSAITLGYINQNLQTDGQGGISTLLSGDLSAASQKFNADVAPALTKQLVAAIEKELQ